MSESDDPREVSPGIWHVPRDYIDNECGGESEDVRVKSGYYFADETQQFTGPYATQELALNALIEYIGSL
jgi:hypothetical protein